MARVCGSGHGQPCPTGALTLIELVALVDMRVVVTAQAGAVVTVEDALTVGVAVRDAPLVMVPHVDLNSLVGVLKGR